MVKVSLSRPKACEIQTFQLTSPILHIGSSVPKLGPFEYVQTSDRLYLPDADALAKALQQRGRLEDYIKAIEDRQGIIQILRQTFGEDWLDQTADDGTAIFPERRTSRKWAKEVTDLRPIIRTGLGYVYIPGSSIKGAIRTAILYHLLKHEAEYQVAPRSRTSAIELKLREKLNAGLSSFQQKFLDDDLPVNSLLTESSLYYQGRAIAARLGPNTDFLRALKVSDSAPLTARKVTTKTGQPRIFNFAVVPEVIVSSHYEDWKAKYRASIYAEMVRDVSTTFTLSLDTEMLSWFTHQQGMKIPFQTISDILKICQEFAQDQWDFEHNYWNAVQNNPRASDRNLDFGSIREFYQAESCPHSLRLGWGSGMTGTTLGLLLEDDLRAEVRDVCGIAAPRFEAPKSRRTVLNAKGEIRYVPGWVTFKPVAAKP
ncbi:MAG: type III-A CRISPR-associated RAMP protein Csm5 [Elainella sp.]